ncbi:16S rRNA (uracil(1498)-N(3))-methyltransferase [Corynebacterium renale]|uniref:16S rRNA (uracil(1498)-N(3))-methyltransferase n=1 Tax=Corynebacterium renale TaxID=1724 RepID=UPI000653263F|nr:16S rRNA (uracil(1498)-N(3))-methyltransferase [Corynebacterium renale]
MSLPVFIAPDLPDVGATYLLDGPEGRHAAVVKRMRVGENLELVDALGTRAECTITAVVGKTGVEVTVDAKVAEPEPQPRVTVVQAIPKAQRAELAVDLATQAGADAIIAWQADRCVAQWNAAKAPKAVEKWRATAQSAAKQARRAYVPDVSGPLSTPELCDWLRSQECTALVLHEDAELKVKDLSGLDAAGHVVVIIGPEGGIGVAETDKLKEAGAMPVVLGPQVLRTASAAMVALSAIGMVTSRW